MLLLVYMLCVVLVLIWFRVSIAFAFAFAAITGAVIFDIPLAASFSNAFHGIQGFGLLALPLFIYLGFLMERGALGEYLISFVELVLSRVKSAIPLITVVTCALLGAVSGAASAAVAAVGSVMIPRAVARGYRRGYITGLVAASSVLTLLIPPSIPMLVYALAANISIQAAFLTTIVPAVMVLLGYTVITLITTRRRSSWVFEEQAPLVHASVASEQVTTTVGGGTGSGGAVKLRSRGADAPLKGSDLPPSRWISSVVRSLPRVLPLALIPLAVLGSIYGGFASPTEAAALGVWTVLILGMVVYRTLTLPRLKLATRDAAILTGALVFMLFTIQLFSSMVIGEGLPFLVVEWFRAVGLGPLTALLMLNIILLGIGMIMDDISGSAFAAALLTPIAMELGVEPLHFAAIVGINLGLGNLTPPVAPLVYLAGGVGKVGMRPMLPSLGWHLLTVNVPILILVTYVPDITMWLPRALGYA